MKTKIKRIVGVALTVMLLGSLMVGFAAAPAGAVEGVWTSLSLPVAGGPGGWVMGTAANPFGAPAGSLITQAIDGTLWAYRDDGVATTNNLYSSTTGGYSWARTGGTTLNNIALVAIVCDPTDANKVWVASATTIYETTTCGTTWTSVIANGVWTGTVVVTDIDVAYKGGQRYLFAACADTGAAAFGGAHVLGPAYGANWVDLQIDWQRNTSAAFAASRVDVYAIKAAPDFDVCDMVVAVTSNETNSYAVTKLGGANWNADVFNTTVQPIACGAPLLDNAAVIPMTGANNQASIAFPDDYSSCPTTGGFMEYFVGINEAITPLGDVFRVVIGDAYDRNVAGAATSTQISGIDVIGNVGSANVLAGGAVAVTGSGRTWYTSDNTATWLASQAANHPAGAGAQVRPLFDKDFLTNSIAYVATRGNEGGIQKSTDCRTWRGIGLLNTLIITMNDFDIGVGSETAFVSVNDGADDMIWRHDGTHWEVVLFDTVWGFNPLRVQATDTYASDTTAFAGDTAARSICRTTNGGDRWVGQLNRPPAAWASWVVQSPSELLVGNAVANGLVYQTTANGTTWLNRNTNLAGANIVSFDKSPEYATDSSIIAGTSTGLVALSTNTGTNWAQIPSGAGVLGAATNTFVAFNGADSQQVFAANVTGTTVHRYNLGGTAWTGTIIVGTSPAPGVVASTAITAATTGITSSPDGSLYVADVAAGAGASRCVNPEAGLTPVATAPFFETLNPAGSLLPAAAVTVAGPVYTPGSNKIWVGVNAPAVRLYYYEDACVEGPTGIKVSNVGQTFFTVSWDAVDAASRYIFWYNQADIGWSGAGQVDVTSTGANVPAAGVGAGPAPVSGTKYHFRIAVHEQSPALSRWSEVVEVNTLMGAAQWSPFPVVGNFSPAPGAKGVDPIQTLFQWNPATNAEGYEFQLSDNAAFAGADTKKVKAPTYGWPGDLEYGKTYYWRVRSHTDGIFSEWATGIFTTALVPVTEVTPAPAPAPPAPAPVIVPQAIPSFLLWTIVGIGAVLLIALIWLIMRTRRVA